MPIKLGRSKVTGMRRLFTAHPGSVGESYWQHAAAALRFSFQLSVAALAALVHAFFPFLFTYTSSRLIQKLHKQMVIERTKNVSHLEQHDQATAMLKQE